MMQCELCGGEVGKEKITYSLFYEDNWVIVEGVPAFVCKQCGEKSFTPETVERIHKVLESRKNPVKQIQTPVYDLSQVA